MKETSQKELCIIGVDLGTSSTKVLAYNAEGQVIAMARRSYNLLSPQKGYAEQDPEVHVDAAMAAISEVCAAISNKSEVAGISFSAAMHSLIVLNREHQPISPVITWADTRSSAEADEIRHHAEAGLLYQRTGVPIHPMTPLSKICWIRKNQPELYQSAAMFSGIKEYLLYRLLGVHVMDHSMASATGMFDIHSLDWYPPALEMAGINKNQLPRLVSTTQAFYSLDPELCKTWKIPSTVPVIIGASDGCLANLGTGAVEKGDLAITVGTSGAVRMAAGKAEPDSRGRTFNYILSPGMYIAGGPINNGSIILKWFTEKFLHLPYDSETDFTSFHDKAAKAPPGSEGLICLPYFLGERAPVWNAEVKAMFHGLQIHHGMEHMMRSIVEGISFSLFQIASILTESQGPVKQVFASGGFIHSSHWMQIIADIFQQPVQITHTEDASAIGAAMLGWLATGKISGLEETRKWISIQKVYQPNPERREVYEKAFREYCVLSEWEESRSPSLTAPV